MNLKYTIDYYNGNILFYSHELKEKLNLSLEDYKSLDNTNLKKINLQCNLKAIFKPIVAKNNLVYLRLFEYGKRTEFIKKHKELCSGLTTIYIPKGYLYQYNIIKKNKGIELTLKVLHITLDSVNHVRTCKYFAYDKFEIYVY